VITKALEKNMGIVTFVLGIIVGAAGVWYYLNQKSSDELSARDREINRLKSELANAERASESSSPAKLSPPKQKNTVKPKAKTPESNDDLTRIKGIGKVLAEKLKEIGIHSYEQIADFKKADIERVKQKINVRGRGEPKNWIEQARLLVNKDQHKS
jgi:predicted flap endonuclease-1-like 5' DNA nuclease